MYKYKECMVAQTQKLKTMDICKLWKQIKAFKKDSNLDDFENTLNLLGYRVLAWKNVSAKSLRKKVLVISPSSRLEEITLGKTKNILSIVSKA